MYFKFPRECPSGARYCWRRRRAVFVAAMASQADGTSPPQPSHHTDNNDASQHTYDSDFRDATSNGATVPQPSAPRTAGDSIALPGQASSAPYVAFAQVVKPGGAAPGGVYGSIHPCTPPDAPATNATRTRAMSARSVGTYEFVSFTPPRSAALRSLRAHSPTAPSPPPPPAPSPPNSTRGFDWTRRLVELEAMSGTDPAQAVDKFRAVSRLSQDFAAFVEMYATIIVSELPLPDEQKTIRPDTSLGGAAGGQKYVVRYVTCR